VVSRIRRSCFGLLGDTIQPSNPFSLYGTLRWTVVRPDERTENPPQYAASLPLRVR
jgi:hypothetical protein